MQGCNDEVADAERARLNGQLNDLRHYITTLQPAGQQVTKYEQSASNFEDKKTKIIKRICVAQEELRGSMQALQDPEKDKEQVEWSIADVAMKLHEVQSSVQQETAANDGGPADEGTAWRAVHDNLAFLNHSATGMAPAQQQICQVFYELAKQFAAAWNGSGAAPAAQAGTTLTGSGPPPSLTPVSRFQQPVTRHDVNMPEVRQQQPQAMPTPAGPPASNVPGQQNHQQRQQTSTSQCCWLLPHLCTCSYVPPEQQPQQAHAHGNGSIGPAQRAFLMQQQQQAAETRQSEFVKQQAAELGKWQEAQAQRAEIESKEIAARVQQEAAKQKQAADLAAMQHAQAAHLLAQQQQHEQQQEAAQRQQAAGLAAFQQAQAAQALFQQQQQQDGQQRIQQAHAESASTPPPVPQQVAANDQGSTSVPPAVAPRTKEGLTPFSRRVTEAKIIDETQADNAPSAKVIDGGLQAVPDSEDEVEGFLNLSPERKERRSADYKPSGGATDAATRRARDLQVMQKEARETVMQQKRTEGDAMPTTTEFVDCADDTQTESDEMISSSLVQHAQSLLTASGDNGAQAKESKADGQQQRQQPTVVEQQQPFFRQASVVPQHPTMLDHLSTATFDKEVTYMKGVDCVKNGSCPVVRQATLLMYGAAHTLFVKREAEIRHFWNTSQEALPVIYRQIRALEWPQLGRKTCKDQLVKGVKGCCLGASRGVQPRPYCNFPNAYVDLAKTIVANAVSVCPAFQFTSIQVNVGLASALHTDGGNVGPSMVLAVGPFTGGLLWTHRAAEGQVVNVRNWAYINERVHHRTLPHAGDRFSIVLFTHAAAASQVSLEAVGQAAFTGLPAPPHPAAFTPGLDDLRYTNMGMQPAATTFRALCESTMELAAGTVVPTDRDESLIAEEGAKQIIDSKPVGFLHRSLLMTLFYAAFILGSLQATTASVAVRIHANTMPFTAAGDDELHCGDTGGAWQFAKTSRRGATVKHRDMNALSRMDGNFRMKEAMAKEGEQGVSFCVLHEPDVTFDQPVLEGDIEEQNGTDGSRGVMSEPAAYVEKSGSQKMTRLCNFVASMRTTFSGQRLSMHASASWRQTSGIILMLSLAIAMPQHHS